VNRKRGRKNGVRGAVRVDAAQAIPGSSTMKYIGWDQHNHPTEKMIDGNNIVATNALKKQQYYYLLYKLGIRYLHT